MLFSHSDQSNQWQTGIPAGNGSSGWGGRITDLLQSQNAGAHFPGAHRHRRVRIVLYRASTLPASVPPTGMSLLNTYSGSPSIASGFQQLLTFDNGVQLVQAANGIMTRGNTYANTLTGLIGGVTLQTVFPAGNLLASQLQTVATVMAVRSQLGLTRQIFFCFLDGFDTHGAQMETQGPLLQQLSQAVLAFYQATIELGIDSSVTTFTASEFGRTLTPSGSRWQRSCLGQPSLHRRQRVKGGKFYGNFPLLVPGGSDDANTRGVLIPTTAVDQYGSTLAQWFGVAAPSLPTVFPNVANFPTNNLGFLG